MGWLFTHGMTRTELVKHLTSGEPEWPKTLAHKVVGSMFEPRQSVLWAVMESSSAPGGKFIACFLLDTDPKVGAGYKDMTESMGPCELSCPVKFLDMVQDPGHYATEWRVKVRAYHAAKAAKTAHVKQLQVGSVVKLIPNCTLNGQSITEATVVSLKPLLFEVNGFGRVKVPKKYIAAS